MIDDWRLDEITELNKQLEASEQARQAAEARLDSMEAEARRYATEAIEATQAKEQAEARVAELNKMLTSPRDRDGLCYYCGELTNCLAGNPSQWPITLCHKDEPGVPKPHHVGCVSERLEYAEQAEAKLADYEEVLDEVANGVPWGGPPQDHINFMRDLAFKVLVKYGMEGGQ